MSAHPRSSDEGRSDYVQRLERDLVMRHGHVIGGATLRHLLSYSSADAFRQAVRRGTVPIPTFPLPHRRGRFAIAQDVAEWIETCRVNSAGWSASR
jgi:hypothetical protein